MNADEMLNRIEKNSCLIAQKTQQNTQKHIEVCYYDIDEK